MHILDADIFMNMLDGAFMHILDAAFMYIVDVVFIKTESRQSHCLSGTEPLLGVLP